MTKTMEEVKRSRFDLLASTPFRSLFIWGSTWEWTKSFSFWWNM